MRFIPAKKFTRGRAGQRVQFIVCHWWDDPRRKPSLDGVVSWFRSGRGNNSAHYVVEAGQSVQMVRESDTAWHAGNWLANLRSIGIEINPRLSDGDYQAAAELIRDVRARVGDVQLRAHRDVSNRSTSCPGTLNLARLDALARRLAVPAPAPQKPAAPRHNWLTVGARGSNVRTLQAGLIKVFPAYRHTCGRLAVTGFYDETTARWVREFQRRTGLYPDGKVGPLTVAGLARFGIRVTL